MRPELVSRVQRIVAGEVPVLHLEPEIPAGEWPVVVDGLVESPCEIATDELHASERIVRHVDLHCVWGWSRPDERWEGVHLNALAMRVRPLPEAAYVVVSSRSGCYGGCFTLEEARDGLFAWRVGGRDVGAERGWPLRFVGPSYKWGYKSVKWVERVTFADRFTPSLWESRVADPKGDVPWDVLQRFAGAAERWSAKRW